MDPSISTVPRGLWGQVDSTRRAGRGHGAGPSSPLACPPSRRRCLMKSILACLTALLLATVVDDGYLGARASADTLPATLTGSALLDDWGSRFTSLGVAAPENPLRTQVRTTIAQLAMFDAVNAVLDGPYRPFASKPAAAPGASPDA